MKRSRFVALVLAAAIMLLGAGYAAWSDTITVRSSVSTGYLDVDFVENEDDGVIGTDRTLTAPDGLEYHKSYVDEASNIVITSRDSSDDVTGEQAPNNDKALVSLLNFYPGASASATMRFRNTGTIPARFESMDVDLTELGDNANFFTCTVKIFGGNEFNWRDYLEHPGEYGLENIIISNVSLTDLEDELNDILSRDRWFTDFSGDTIPVDEEVVLVIDIAADDYESNGETITMIENATNGYNFNLDIVFGQFNK